MNHSNNAPKGYQTVTPQFTVERADEMIAFMCNVFGAVLLNRSTNGSGGVTHAEVKLGDTVVEVSDGSDSFPARHNTVHVFVDDPDDRYRRALDEGATSLYEPADMPYGERGGGIVDPFGNHWYIAKFSGGTDRGYYD